LHDCVPLAVVQVGNVAWLEAQADRRSYRSWTGTEMIVWGGFDDSGLKLNTGGRHDRNTHNWTRTSVTKAPRSTPLSHGSVEWERNDRVRRRMKRSNTANTGGRYCAEFGLPPTPTATAAAPSNPAWDGAHPRRNRARTRHRGRSHLLTQLTPSSTAGRLGISEAGCIAERAQTVPQLFQLQCSY